VLRVRSARTHHKFSKIIERGVAPRGLNSLEASFLQTGIRSHHPHVCSPAEIAGPLHHKTLFVKAPKTERHEGHASRFVPLCEQLVDLLVKASEQAAVGAIRIFDDLRITDTSLNNRLAGTCRRAKVIMWEKPKINLRASCEFDWLRTHTIDKVAAWMGHSPKTMLKHYNRVFKEQSARAAAGALHAPNGTEPALQNAKRA
jgi:integrase